MGLAMLLMVGWFSAESAFHCNTVEAQVVVVGRAAGVRVRAPFVSVDVLPFYRGTRVRVPYAAIDTGFYRSYRPFPPYTGFVPLPVPYPYAVAAAPVFPVAAPVFPVAAPTFPVIDVPVYPRFAYPEMPIYEYPSVIYPDVGVAVPSAYDSTISSSRPRLELSLPERLRTAAETLARTLSLREDGDVWLNYLGPQRIIENVDYGRPAAELQDLMINYDGVVMNGTLGSIQYARGFAASRDLLRQYLRNQSFSKSPDNPPVSAPPQKTLPQASPSQTVPEPPAPQLPKKRSFKDVPLKPAGAEEKSNASETEVQAMQVPRLSQAVEGEKPPRTSATVQQPTSL